MIQVSLLDCTELLLAWLLSDCQMIVSKFTLISRMCATCAIFVAKTLILSEQQMIVII